MVLARLLLPLLYPPRQRMTRQMLRKQLSFKLAVSTKLRFSNKQTKFETAVLGCGYNLPLMERKERLTGTIYLMRWFGYPKNFKENVVGNFNKLVK
jgi:hypothetical protein